MKSPALVVALLVGAVAVSRAQAPDEPHLLSPILSGAGLGAAGFAVGGLTALYLARHCESSELCGLEASFYGAAAGGTIGMALGVHLGNDRHGSLPLDLVTGAAVWAVGIGTTVAGHPNETAIWIAFVSVPIVQLASTVAVERAVGRARTRRVGLTVVPGRDGGVLLLGRVSLH